MSVHELLGREAEARCALHAEYCRLLGVFQEVVSGLVHPARIQINLDTNSWTKLPLEVEHVPADAE